MAVHTQKGTGSVDAFQWMGGLLSSYALPSWAKNLFLHTPGDNSLHVPVRTGVEAARVTDSVLKDADGTINIMTAANFAVLYN